MYRQDVIRPRTTDRRWGSRGRLVARCSASEQSAPLASLVLRFEFGVLHTYEDAAERLKLIRPSVLSSSLRARSHRPARRSRLSIRHSAGLAAFAFHMHSASAHDSAHLSSAAVTPPPTAVRQPHQHAPRPTRRLRQGNTAPAPRRLGRGERLALSPLVSAPGKALTRTLAQRYAPLRS